MMVTDLLETAILGLSLMLFAVLFQPITKYPPLAPPAYAWRRVAVYAPVSATVVCTGANGSLSTDNLDP